MCFFDILFKEGHINNTKEKRQQEITKKIIFIKNKESKFNNLLNLKVCQYKEGFIKLKLSNFISLTKRPLFKSNLNFWTKVLMLRSYYISQKTQGVYSQVLYGKMLTFMRLENTQWHCHSLSSFKLSLGPGKGVMYWKIFFQDRYLLLPFQQNQSTQLQEALYMSSEQRLAPQNLRRRSCVKKKK